MLRPVTLMLSNWVRPRLSRRVCEVIASTPVTFCSSLELLNTGSAVVPIPTLIDVAVITPTLAFVAVS